MYWIKQIWQRYFKPWRRCWIKQSRLDKEDGKDLFKDQGNSLAHRCLNGAWQKQSCL